MASNNFLILVLTTRGTEVQLSVSDKGDIGLDTGYQIEAAAIACGVWGGTFTFLCLTITQGHWITFHKIHF